MLFEVTVKWSRLVDVLYPQPNPHHNIQDMKLSVPSLVSHPLVSVYLLLRVWRPRRLVTRRSKPPWRMRRCWLRICTELGFGLHASTPYCAMKDSKDSPKGLQTTNQRHHRRRWTVFGAALLSLIFAFYGSVFPRDYAICSGSTDIYTVDESRPRVECMLVRGSHIIDIGSQG